MAQFLMSEKVRCENLKHFLIDNAESVKKYAQDTAAAAGRPYIYLPSAGTKMERQARELAEADGISEGLVCIFAKLEPCKSFSFKYYKNSSFVKSATRKCLHIYYYFMDREFGLVMSRSRRGSRCTRRHSSTGTIGWRGSLTLPVSSIRSATMCL